MTEGREMVLKRMEHISEHSGYVEFSVKMRSLSLILVTLFLLIFLLCNFGDDESSHSPEANLAESGLSSN
jgi:hypothetical protein|nr:hypothetical protein Q903MT_gene5038 [Picea sitchensis]